MNATTTTEKTETTYGAFVAKNLAHMGTSGNEWTAAPCEMIQTEEGTAPLVSIPRGYVPAPTLVPDGSAMGDKCACLLCGHDIKNCYAIIHHGNKWHLRVGSECVTHFAKSSGADLARDAELERAKRAVECLRQWAKSWNEYGGVPTAQWANKLLGAGALATDGAVRSWWRYRRPTMDRVIVQLRNQSQYYTDKGGTWDKYGLPQARMANELAEIIA